MAETLKFTFKDNASLTLEPGQFKYYLTLFNPEGEETNGWKYSKLEIAKKAFNNIINSYPDVKVN